MQKSANAAMMNEEDYYGRVLYLYLRTPHPDFCIILRVSFQAGGDCLPGLYADHAVNERAVLED
jgi:hypothetical protein